ncbi:hypothetical protein TrCOL_g12731 [Triparma columacea]|uniref:phosphatidyl-N-methylethanolamine N-methyltransferase n=1 Tax=Triparma columacea TaxID=722753 RepID=A0A9W7LD03_9STRA|nr:hypothetical protein TrCOL_g12731 [Triparma columacea]
MASVLFAPIAVYTFATSIRSSFPPLTATIKTVLSCDIYNLSSSPLQGILNFITFSFVEHLVYTWVWVSPESFKLILKAKSNPTDRVHTLLIICKFLQLATSLPYLLPYITLPSSLSVTLFCTAFIALGQFLNFSVYKAIGKKGVYYGAKFGYSVPWVKGFPYNIGMPHPQYLGTVVTYVAGWRLLVGENLDLEYGKVFVTGIGISYWGMSMIEQYV